MVLFVLTHLSDNELEGIGANGQLFCFVVRIAVSFGHGKCNEVSHSPRDEVTVSC